MPLFVRTLPLLALFALLATTVLGTLPNAAQTEGGVMAANKTPKSAHLFTDTCTECQTIIQRMADVAGDPQKVMELKAILMVMCDETSYKEECQLFVSKLDLFLKELLPYLRNPHTVCHWLHICGNSRVQQFHRVGLLYAKKYVNRVQGAKDLVCEECQFAAHEMQNIIDDPTYQSEAKQWVEDNICSLLGHYQGTCDTIIDEVMPEVWQELHDWLQNAKQFCVDIDLCDPTERVLVSRVTGQRQSQQAQPHSPVPNAEPTADQSTQQTTVASSQKQKVSKRVIQTLFPASNDDE